MNLHRTYGPLDDQPHLLGDTVFARLDMQADPATLPAGNVAESWNYRFDNQGATPRAGLARMLPAGITQAEIRWAGIYRPAESNDRIALVTETSLILFNPADQDSDTYNFPGTETITATDPVDLVQAGVSATTVPDIYILRGLNKTVLKFDGSSIAVAASFRQGLLALFYQDRMAVASGDSSLTRSQQIDVSDFLDFTNWSLLNQFKVSKGGDDYIVGLLPYQKDFVLVGTRKRFFLAYFDPKVSAVPGTGYTGGIEDTSFLRELTRSNGLLGRRGWLEANGKIWFLSDRAIFAFSPQLDLELTVVGQPISTPIQPLLDRLSANYASGADAKQHGQRLYWAMPISDAPVKISSIAVSASGPPYTQTVTTAADHNLAAGDTVQISTTLDAGLNGLHTVESVTSSTVFVCDTTAVSGAEAGERGTMQRIATRNNVIAVYNTGLGESGEWESIDTLPRGVYADWLLVADYGAQRRLWVVDKTLGPCLYEEGDQDEFGEAQGGVRLPQTLPFLLSSANFESSPVAAELVSREYTWGQTARQVKAGAALLKLATADRGTMTLTVRTPREDVYTTERDFDGATDSNVLARKRAGKRGLGAQVAVTSAAGRPVVRALEVEIVNAGRTAED